MIPTYTTSIKEGIISNYLGVNLVVLLINNASLGITDTPTQVQLDARAAYTMTNVFSTEIGATVLNGYARQIVLPGDIIPTVVTSELTEAEITVAFTAVGDMDAFSHFVVVRGADLSGADATGNGNNRGSTIGDIIFIEPVDNGGSPLILTDGNSIDYTFKLIASTETV